MMEMMIIFLLFCMLLILFFTGYNSRGFNRKGIHKNGTRYDDFGYDAKGFDREGYNQKGYNADGYNRQGYNSVGYNREGKNIKGEYNRYYDNYIEKDGFYNPRRYPVKVTKHAKDRIIERLTLNNHQSVESIAVEAYCHGKSKRQIKKSSAALVKKIEEKHDNCVLLIYKGYIYVFSVDNKLITVYKNERIPL